MDGTMDSSIFVWNFSFQLNYFRHAMGETMFQLTRFDRFPEERTK